MDGNSCPTCHKRYDFVTTGPFGIGLIKPVHPPGPCRPPAPVQYEPEDERECSRCHRAFSAKGKHGVCVACRAARKREAARQLNRERSPVRNVEPRPCPFCFTWFKPRVRCQEGCGSRDCKKAYWRKYQKQRRAA